MTSKEIVIDLDNIKTIPDDNYIDNIKINIRFCINNNMRLIVFILLFIIIGIVAGVISTSKITPFPCYTYSYNTLASSVSIQCLQYLWTKNGCLNTKPQIPNDYNGYYLRSPNGLNTVHCNSINSGKNCGVGSYNNIIVNLQFCNLNRN
jgi:hypothetical protein